MMRSLSLFRCLIKSIALIFASCGLALHVYLTYDSPFMAALLFTAIVVVDVLSLAVLWPRALEPRQVRT
ncbi:MAG: hypothetical protein M1546_13830 [Chloroflexi bacterium]|nr:hypothetical protein [Chloroflexota bacterium]